VAEGLPGRHAEADFIPVPHRSNLLIALMRIGVTLSTLWGLEFILAYRRHDKKAVTWAILAAVLVGTYWIAAAAGAFAAMT